MKKLLPGELIIVDEKHAFQNEKKKKKISNDLHLQNFG